MTKQEVLDKIKTINSGIGLSGYFTSLSKEHQLDMDIRNALKARRKEL
jgi:hypothetical protein